MKIICCFVAATLMGLSCLAQTESPSEIPTAAGEGVERTEHIPTYSHPTLPAEGQLWAVPMLIIVAGMFLAAAIVGPLHRMEMPPEQPDAHAAHAAHGHDDHGHH